MRMLSKRFFLLPLLAASLGGCGMSNTTSSADYGPGFEHDPIAAIRAAGAREESVIKVHALVDPGIAALQQAARRDEQAGHYAAAAAKLDQALKLNPRAPDLLQDRAEMAIRLQDYAAAERLARQSWSLGPKFGPLCARNWQTVVELHARADDPTGAATARKWVQTCHKAGVPRY